MSSPPPSNERIEAQYGEYVTPIWKHLDVPVARAAGCTLEDFDGDEYLDVFSGISVTNVGHRNESVVAAAKEQLDEFVHGCSYVHPNRPDADLAHAVSDGLRDRGVVVGVGGFYGNVLWFQPPLTITRDQLATAVDALDAALSEVVA